MVNFEKKYLKYKQKYLINKIEGGSVSSAASGETSRNINDLTERYFLEEPDNKKEVKKQDVVTPILSADQGTPQQQNTSNDKNLQRRLQESRLMQNEPRTSQSTLLLDEDTVLKITKPQDFTDVDLLEYLLKKVKNIEPKHLKALQACIISEDEKQDKSSDKITMTSTLARLLVNTILETIDIHKMSGEPKKYLNTIKYIRLKKAIEIPINLEFKDIDLEKLFNTDPADYREETVSAKLKDIMGKKSANIKYSMKPYISKKYTDLFSKSNLKSLYPNIYVPQALFGFGLMSQNTLLFYQGIKYKIFVNPTHDSDKIAVSFIYMDLTKDIYNRLLSYIYTSLYLDVPLINHKTDESSPSPQGSPSPSPSLDAVEALNEQLKEIQEAFKIILKEQNAAMQKQENITKMQIDVENKELEEAQRVMDDSMELAKQVMKKQSEVENYILDTVKMMQGYNNKLEALLQNPQTNVKVQKAKVLLSVMTKKIQKQVQVRQHHETARQIQITATELKTKALQKLQDVKVTAEEAEAAEAAEAAAKLALKSAKEKQLEAFKMQSIATQMQKELIDTMGGGTVLDDFYVTPKKTRTKPNETEMITEINKRKTKLRGITKQPLKRRYGDWVSADINLLESITREYKNAELNFPDMVMFAHRQEPLLNNFDTVAKFYEKYLKEIYNTEEKIQNHTFDKDQHFLEIAHTMKYDPFPFNFEYKSIFGPHIKLQKEQRGADDVNNYLDYILHILRRQHTLSVSDTENTMENMLKFAKTPSMNITYYYCLEDLIKLLEDNKDNVDDNSVLLELIIMEFQSLTHKKEEIDIDFICSLLKYVKDLVSKKNVPQFITSINKIAKEFIEHILLKYYSDEAFIEYLLKENKDNLLALLEKNQAYYEDTRKSFNNKFGKSTSGSNLSEELDKNIGEIHQIKITSENGEEARVNYQQVGKK